MRLILIRHGETGHNRGNVTLGRADVPLTYRGLAQARAAAASFTRPPDAIYSSPLSRALRTAEIIGAQAVRTPAVEGALIEMDVGEMEHLTGAELRERYPEFLRIWMSGDCADVRMPGGETLREVQERAWSAVERIATRHTGPTVAAVTHNFVISMLVCRALDLPIAGFRRMRPGLGSRTVIDLGERGPMLVQFNDISHLLAAGLADDSMGEARR